MAEKNTFGQVKIGAYSARTEELLSTLLKLADRWEVIADDVEGDCYAVGAPYPVTGKCITEEHTFCLHQDKGADITTYGLGFKPLRGSSPDIWLSTIHTLCCCLSYGSYGCSKFISRLARSEKDSALLLQMRLRENEAACWADGHPRVLDGQKKAVKDLAAKLRMLCIILCSLCEPETKKIEITTTTVKNRYELTEEYKKAVYQGTQYPTYFHPETYAEADPCCKTTALSTSTATLSTTKEELLAFADFLGLLPAPKKSAVKQFEEQHGEAAYEKFMGAASYDPFKLASYALVEKAAREADEALLA